MNFKLISCDVFKDELVQCIAKTKNIIDVEFIAKGIHDLKAEDMLKRIHKSIRSADENGYHAILLGYGLCNTWVYGLTAGRTPLVIPRSHDCIGVLMGSHEKYLRYYFENPGTYFQSAGWMKKTKNEPTLKKRSLQKLYGMDMTDHELSKRFGSENLSYLKQELNQTRNYEKITFVDTKVEGVNHYQKKAQGRARQKKWIFETIEGDTRLLQKLVDGHWNENEFLVVSSGERVDPTYGRDLMVGKSQ